MRDESGFSRGEADLAIGELKRIERAGVDVWFYQDRHRFKYGNLDDDIVGYVNVRAAFSMPFSRRLWVFMASHERPSKRKSPMFSGKIGRGERIEPPTLGPEPNALPV